MARRDSVAPKSGRRLVSVSGRMDEGEAVLLDVAAELAGLSKSAAMGAASIRWATDVLRRDPHTDAAAVDLHRRRHPGDQPAVETPSTTTRCPVSARASVKRGSPEAP